MKIMISMDVEEGLDPDDESGLDEPTFVAIMSALAPYGDDIDIRSDEA